MIRACFPVGVLYATPALEPADQAVLAEIEDMRRDLKYRLAETHRWDGQLRRQLQARAIQGSNSIEGYRASVEDIESIMAGEGAAGDLRAGGAGDRRLPAGADVHPAAVTATALRYEVALLNASTS
jgi:hypothetical protein